MKNIIQKYALLSVYDKRNITSFAKKISALGFHIISTGGTARELRAQGIPVIPVEKITGNPECFDGRMKTISFQIESGILFDRKNRAHSEEAKRLNIPAIDVVVCNLYPFEKKNSIENIDVGGPTMIRAAAKNCENVLVVIDPEDYERVAAALEEGNILPELRRSLAAKAFAHTAFYDSLIASYFNRELFPQELTLPLRKQKALRYGENPHQQAALYVYPTITSPLSTLKRKWGRELSLINVTDINAGIEEVYLFIEPAAAVIKHNTPCGLALGGTITQALRRAIDADPQSAFGGVVVLNKQIDIKTSRIIGSFKNNSKGNIDIITAPSITEEALRYLQKIRKNMGIYTFEESGYQDVLNSKWVNGGLVIQTVDNNKVDSFAQWQVVTKVKPTKKQLSQMKIAWKFISRIRSNSILIMDKTLPIVRGIGSGQTSRIASTRIALDQASHYLKDGILASDSFFPFDDSVKEAARRGIKAIIQQGGSVRDIDSIQAADKVGIAMVFTGKRAFWH